jgi:acyl-CoA synthetase (AMP-forming)/AMP-acid ligase II
MPTLLPSNTVLFDGNEFSWGELIDDTLRKTRGIDQFRRQRVIFVASNELEAVSFAATGISQQLDFGVVDSSRLGVDLKLHLSESGITLVSVHGLDDAQSVTPKGNIRLGRISVLTSGTTGLPKLVSHTPDSLNTFDRVRTLGEHSWFVPYQIGSYAWYQMVALGLFVDGQRLVLPRSLELMESFGQALRKQSITAVSSTPTFWRQAAMSIDLDVLQASAVVSISLGGEIVDQAILDFLSTTFPAARIKHIYASSETGAAIVVSDGLAGFNASVLNDSAERPVSVRIVGERLQVRSRYGNSDAAGTWVDTGDVVERVGDRVFFRGRADNQMINVGGQKAFPAVIEGVLLSHPDVVWAQIVAKRAPLMGYLPAANLVLKPGISPAQAEIVLSQFCEAQLPDYAVPRLWNFLDTVPIRASLKS